MNAGPIIHPPLITMNAGPIEHFDKWDIHKEGTQPAIRRVEYDVEKEAARLLASSYPLKEWIAETRRRGSYVPPPEENG